MLVSMATNIPSTYRHYDRDVNRDRHANRAKILASRSDQDHVTVSWERLEGLANLLIQDRSH